MNKDTLEKWSFMTFMDKFLLIVYDVTGAHFTHSFDTEEERHNYLKDLIKSLGN